MSETIVYGCDWCKEIVPKRRDDELGFAMKVTAEQKWPYPPMGEKPRVYDICGTCRDAFRALTEGKFKR